MRRGPQEDLPGAPLNLTIPTFSESLGEAEFGYATDTGRLFIGSIPSSGQINFNRITFPYQNLEILTERSSTVFRRMAGVNNRVVGNEAYITSATIAHDGNWRSIMYGNPLKSYTFNLDSFAAEIKYAVWTADNIAKRIGTLRIIHIGETNAPTLEDDALSVPTANDVRFRLSRVSGDNPQFLFQCRNTSDFDIKILFNVIYLTM